MNIESQGSKSGNNNQTNVALWMDYYQRPFLLIHSEHARTYHNFQLPHPIRKRFWELIPPGQYNLERARVFLNSYLVSVESELAKHISGLSIAYCIHLYRRLSPGAIGRDNQPHTIGLTRAALEASIQKYASFQLCDKIAESATIPISKVLNGLLMAPEFQTERDSVSKSNQLVLVNFSVSDLESFYDLERLAYEIWKTAAALRTVGKGAPLTVDYPPECFFDERSSELDFLVTNYDHRLGKSGWSYSASGVVFDNSDTASAAGVAFTPTYNITEIPGSDYKKLFTELFNINIRADMPFNFAWFPFNFREYYEAHLPFSTAFRELHGVSLEAVLIVIVALTYRVLRSWFDTRGTSFIKFHQRAYELCTVGFIQNEIIKALPEALKVLGIDEASVSAKDIQKAIGFWSLSETHRKNIDLSYSGPHFIFLPVQKGKVFVDYAWITRRLYDLFLGINIPDQNFKGNALEKMVRKSKSLLPNAALKNKFGQERQIDYATAVGSTLVIVECKAVGRSIAFERGEPIAIKYRTDNVVERALHQVDDKAQWLLRYPVGSNYDVTGFDYILPIAVSPFVEFIPSQKSRYWISKDIPRVLTPVEFEKTLNNVPAIENSFNRVSIKK